VTAVHLVVPEGIDDPARPSGGNTFDRRVVRGLASTGWRVHVHEAKGSWPKAASAARATLADLVAGIPDGAVVLVDGLVASPSPDVLVPEAERLRLVVLVHMPLGRAGENRAAAREAAVLSAARSIVTTSAWTRHVLLELYPLPGDRVRVAEPGVDAARLVAGTENAGAFLCVAAVTAGKGHDVLLDALAMLADDRWRCLCVGSLDREPTFADEARRRVLDRALGARVRFSGTQTAIDLARSYAAADVLVLPSRGETYGMVVTEALARGLPVIASDVGGVPEALGHGADGTRPGLLVAPDDPEALGGALRDWLRNPGLRRRLRRAARERRASLVSWSATTAVVADVLAEAVR
jgi:glycosyltransferase involved in cell wall biosynthesis